MLVATACAAVPVKIANGLIAGEERDGVRGYKGIPFAAPPVGDLRWKPPQPVKPWDGVRDGTKFGAICPQPKSILGTKQEQASEDCLFLNVWTAATNADAKLPVMAWIHGGGCTTGAGSQPSYDGTTFAKAGVVLVTINYRLGPFGYLAHPLLSKEAPHNVSGNYGHLDQIAALQWVQQNIAAFGGDPACVTIFGESAGAMSVCRLMVSPQAKGLFHRAIAQSGGAVGRNRHLRERQSLLTPMETEGERLAQKLGCDKAENPLAALRAKSADEILAAANPAQGLYGKGMKYGPIVDGWTIPADPGDLFEQGQQHDLPFLMGSNADEGRLFLRQIPVQNANAYTLMVRALAGRHAEEALRLLPCESNDVKAAFARFSTVTAFVAPARMLARAMEQKKSPAFLYHFTRVSSNAKLLGLGATHGAEIAYVFGTQRAPAAKDRELGNTMRACWIQFAKTGNPNGAGLPQWPAYKAATDEHLEFGDEIRTGRGLYKEACDLLEKLKNERAKSSTPAKNPTTNS
jgi:para-nitrobenzyl esterase